MPINTTPLSPRDRKMISPKSTCSPVCRVRRFRRFRWFRRFRRFRSDSSVYSRTMPFPPFYSNKRRVTFGKCDICEYEKGSAPNKLRRILCAPLKKRKPSSVDDYKELPPQELFPEIQVEMLT